MLSGSLPPLEENLLITAEQLASAIVGSLPEDLLKHLQSDDPQRGLILLRSIDYVAELELRMNFNVVLAVLQAFPDRVPGIHFLADVMMLLERDHSLRNICPGQTYADKYPSALKIASGVKRLVQAARHLKRRSSFSRDPHIQALKNAITIKTPLQHGASSWLPGMGDETQSWDITAWDSLQ